MAPCQKKILSIYTLTPEIFKSKQVWDFLLPLALFNLKKGTLITKFGFQLFVLKEGNNWTEHEKEFNWWNWTYKLNEAGFYTDALLDIQLFETDSKNSSWRVLGLDLATLILDREYLINGFEDKVLSHTTLIFSMISLSLFCNQISSFLFHLQSITLSFYLSVHLCVCKFLSLWFYLTYE